jgi:hypothetical protein
MRRARRIDFRFAAVALEAAHQVAGGITVRGVDIVNSSSVLIYSHVGRRRFRLGPLLRGQTAHQSAGVIAAMRKTSAIGTCFLLSSSRSALAAHRAKLAARITMVARN